MRRTSASSSVVMKSVQYLSPSGTLREPRKIEGMARYWGVVLGGEEGKEMNQRWGVRWGKLRGGMGWSAALDEGEVASVSISKKFL